MAVNFTTRTAVLFFLPVLYRTHSFQFSLGILHIHQCHLLFSWSLAFNCSSSSLASSSLRCVYTFKVVATSACPIRYCNVFTAIPNFAIFVQISVPAYMRCNLWQSVLFISANLADIFTQQLCLHHPSRVFDYQL